MICKLSFMFECIGKKFVKFKSNEQGYLKLLTLLIIMIIIFILMVGYIHLDDYVKNVLWKQCWTSPNEIN